MTLPPGLHVAACVLLALVGNADVAGGQTPSTTLPRDTVVRRPERITGIVTTDSGVPIGGAIVSATRAPDRAFEQDTTSDDGRFAIHWVQGTGDYLVHVAALGRESVRRRVRRGAPDDTILVVDVALKATAVQIAAVEVRAERPRPPRGTDPIEPPVGGGQSQPEGLYGALSPDQQGDLASLATTLPGMLGTGGGFSAFGLGAGQNSATLDGMAFGGDAVPRESRLLTSIATSPYDVSRGGFSGAEVAMDVGSSGTQFSRRTMSNSIDAPQLQLVDPVARRLGQRFLDVRSSVGVVAPLGTRDQRFYNVSVDVSRRSADAVTLFGASDDALRVAGISPDSVAALGRIVDALGLPRSGGGDVRTTDQVLLLASHGWAEYDWERRRTRNRSGGITTYGQVRRSQSLNASPFAASTQTGESLRATGALLGRYSQYFGEHGDRLLDVRSGVTVRRDETTPALMLPSARVLVASAGDDGSEGLASVGVGGGTAMDALDRRWTWDSRAELQWFANADHRIKVTAQSRLDGYRTDAAANRLGRFTFNSLDDLAAGRAASFSRTLVLPERTGGLWNGAVSIGDFWNAHSRVQLVYGARIEGNRYFATPTENPRIAELFGAPTSSAPDHFHVSPRAGFTVRYSRGAGEQNGFTVSSLGLFPLRPRGYIRGGFGEFRSLPPVTLLSDASAMTGLPGTTSHLLCLGDAVPAPDWRAYGDGSAAIPDACADGGGVFADAAPAVSLVDPAFEPPRSWRGNLSATAQWGRLLLLADGVLSWNRNQSGVVDLNLRNAPVRALASEGGRAMYVTSASIVPATGAVSPVEARKFGEFGRVTSLRSDLRSFSRQLSLTLKPQISLTHHLSVTYTRSSVQEESRGFDGAAFGDVWNPETARGTFDSRHQVLLAAGHTFRRLRGMNVTMYGIFRSGLPYTPYVVGDLNGDGLSNDRAFVHDPAVAAAAGDGQLASDMQSLLADAPGHARECLASQLGRAAGRNSCEGPWTATMNARITIPWELISTSIPRQKRVSMAINVANPLGAVDQLLHGSDALRGWGASTPPDAALYTVTGFDPSAERFRYRVNPRFGSTSPLRTIARNPFRLTLSISVNLGKPVEEQQVSRFLEPGRTRPGTQLDSAALRNRYARSTPDIYLPTIRLADSLLLSPAQVAALEEARRPYRARVDSLWGALAQEFAALPDDFDPAAALRRQEEVTDAGWEINRVEARRIAAILSPLQLSLTQWMVPQLLKVKGPVRWRYY